MRRAFLLGAPLLGLFLLPVVALLLASSPTDIAAGVRAPAFGAALRLSALTSLLSLAVVVALGTPLAWWLGRQGGRAAQIVGAIIELPIVIPPAVVGLALLLGLGRTLGFTMAAVVVAQVVVAGPFFVQSAASAFRRVDPDLLTVARTLGATPAQAFWKVALPLARPGLVAGAALAWARALGEFGATLLFAGNLPGETQTMPLAIYDALQSDVRVAVALALALAGAALAVLLVLRWAGDR